MVRNPGRFETIASSPRLILDGAHNPHGAAALAAAVAPLPGRPRVLVLAVSADKDVAAMIAPLAGVFDRAIATRYDQPRALEPAALAAALSAAGLATEASPTLPLAVDRARALAGLDGVVVVAGSLFAVGEVRPDYMPMAVDPWVVTDPAP
jgi:dihydrofolate synthase/folylpolyglutamate synthase